MCLCHKASVQHGLHREIISGRTVLGRRPQSTLGPGTSVAAVEKTRISQGQVFPGEVCLPPRTSGKEEREGQAEEAVREAQGYDRCPKTVWIDGSRLDAGGAGGAVAWYGEGLDQDPPPPSVSVEEERAGR